MTHTTLHQKEKRVVVIGSGLAGLSTAYLLRQRGITVYLIEKASQIIGHFVIRDDDMIKIGLIR